MMIVRNVRRAINRQSTLTLSDDRERGVVANKQPEVREKTRAALLEAFWRHYGEAPVDRIKIRAITDAAGYNRSTFYQYFDDVYDLLDQAEEALLSDALVYFEEAFEHRESAAFVEKATAAYEHFGYYLSKLLGPHGDPSFATRYRAAIKPLMVKELALDGDDPLADIACEYCLGAFVSVVSAWYGKGKPIPADRLVRLLQELTTRGMSGLVSSNEKISS